MSQPAPVGVDRPDKSLGIVGLVRSFFFTFVGSLVSFIAWRQSRAAGSGNTPALVGVIIGVVALAFSVVLIAVLTPLFAATTM